MIESSASTNYRPLALLLLVLLSGCSSFRPRPYTSSELLAQTTAQTNNSVIVSATAFTTEQSKRQFDMDLAKKGIQPIWVHIQNNSDSTYLLLPSDTDPFYYSAAEIARLFSVDFTGDGDRQQHTYLEKMMIDEYIPPHTTREGFIYAQRKDGIRRASVLLFTEHEVIRCFFLFPGEHLTPDHRYIDFEGHFTNSDTFISITDENLQEQLQALPCYTANARDKKNGDPLNFIVIGTQEELFGALITAGWDETEALNIKTAWRTLRSFVTGRSYRSSPISPLFVFGRRQDAAFQKIRRSIHSRCHLRLWLTPLRYHDTPIWIGQISRDIGVRMTTHAPNLTTHIIDPDVDGDRWYLFQELLRGQALEKVGFVAGGTVYTPQEPGHNLTGDIYYTDGLRAVLLLSNHPTAIDEVQLLDWAAPPDSPMPEHLSFRSKQNGPAQDVHR